MIEVIYDQFRLERAIDNDLEVEEPSHYEACLKSIQACAESHQKLRIFVRNPGIYGWFDSIPKKYGGVLRIKDPLRELSALMNNASLPGFLKKSPELIVKLRLIEKVSASPRKEGETFDSWMMRLLLGPIWSNEELIADEQVTAVLNWYLDESNVSLHPAIIELTNKRLDRWIENSPVGAAVFRWMRSDPFKRSRMLAWEQLLITYPRNRIGEWLQYEGVWAVLSQFPDRHRIMPQWSDRPSTQLPPAIANTVRDFLREEWENRSPLSSLSHMSGKLDLEINFISERLRLQLLKGEAIDQLLYDRLSEVTHSNPQVMGLAKDLVLAPAPAPLNDQADVLEVRGWLREQYLPFYRSCSLLKQLESTFEPVAAFQSWLKQNYPKLLVSGHGMAYRQTQVLKEKLKDNVILLVVVDGLDYLTAEVDLLPALMEKGLFPEEDILPYFTFLPSETPIAKPALLRGKMPSQIPEENPTAAYYSNLVQEAFSLDPHMVRAATSKDMSFEELVSEPAQLYLYLDNHLDADLLHAIFPPAIRKKKYSEHIKHLALALIEADALYEGLFGKKLNIVITSDHGYTEIPENINVVPVSGKSKCRSAFLAEESFPTGKCWELAPEDLFGLRKRMAIPWGYDCFGSRPKGAVHGGATPQEMAVPWVAVSRSRPTPLVPLGLSLEGVIHRRQEGNPLVLRVSNPNPHWVKVLQIQIPSITFDGPVQLDVGPHAVKTVQCQFDASDVTTNFVEISGNYSMQRMGEKRTEQITLHVETTGAMSSEFDDDFDV